MAVLIEVHTAGELAAALEIQPTMLGINNRNLNDFEVRLETTFALRSQVPDGICLVAESGIRTVEDVRLMASVGIDAVLVGEALVTSADLPAKVRELSGYHLPNLVKP
jgi:indole-3-glycerol phosphate synthase